jgi:spore maturation protein CgeB
MARTKTIGNTARKLHKEKAGAKSRVRYSYEKGWKIGYDRGHPYGYHLGQCESITNRANQSVLPRRRDLRILFVGSGQGDPYATIEHGLTEELQPLVRELRVVTPFEDLVQTAISMRPDVMLVFNGLQYVSAETVQRIKEEGIRTIVWMTDDPYYADESGTIARWYDTVVTQELRCVSLYRELGCPDVHYAPFAASTSIYKPMTVGLPYHHDICFLGSGYRNRIELFDAIAPYLASRKTVIAGRWWDRLGSYGLLKSSIRDNEAWQTPEETVRLYNGAKIVINCHRAADDDEINRNANRIAAYSPNPRTFEINACGAMQLVDSRDDLDRFYKPGVEIDTYSSPEELVQKLMYYLQNERERRQIAWNGLARTLREHTYTARLDGLLGAIFGT